jgi:hypothetical protein
MRYVTQANILFVLPNDQKQLLNSYIENEHEKIKTLAHPLSYLDILNARGLINTDPELNLPFVNDLMKYNELITKYINGYIQTTYKELNIDQDVQMTNFIERALQNNFLRDALKKYPNNNNLQMISDILTNFLLSVIIHSADHVKYAMLAILTHAQFEIKGDYTRDLRTCIKNETDILVHLSRSQKYYLMSKCLTYSMPGVWETESNKLFSMGNSIAFDSADLNKGMRYDKYMLFDKNYKELMNGINTHVWLTDGFDPVNIYESIAV